MSLEEGMRYEIAENTIIHSAIHSANIQLGVYPEADQSVMREKRRRQANIIKT